MFSLQFTTKDTDTRENTFILYGLVNLKACNESRGLIHRLFQNSVDYDARDDRGRNIIHAACHPDRASEIPTDEILSYIPSSNAGVAFAVNSTDDGGFAPLHSVSVRGLFAAAGALVNLGADVMVKNAFWEESPLHLAAQFGHEKMISFLLTVGAKVDSIDNRHRTPLFNAVSGGSCGCVKALLSFGAEVDARDREGFTPLLHAASSLPDREELMDVVDILLRSGASVHSSTSGFDDSALEVVSKTAAGVAGNVSTAVKYIRKRINSHQSMYKNFLLGGFRPQTGYEWLALASVLPLKDPACHSNVIDRLGCLQDWDRALQCVRDYVDNPSSHHTIGELEL